MTSPTPVGGAHRLPAEQAREIFETQIAPALLAHAVTSDNPQVVFVTGQTGAGKTAAASEVAQEIDGLAAPVRLDIAMFRGFYPDFPELARDLDLVGLTERVDADTHRWLDMSMQYLHARRADVIVEHPMDTRATADHLITMFAKTDQGPKYRIEIAHVVASAPESRLNTMIRYQDSVDRLGFGRHLDDDAHDVRFEQALVSADWLDDDPRVDAVSIYRRGLSGAQARAYRVPDGDWSSPTPTATVIETLRARRWSVEDSREWVRGFASLWARMEPQFRQTLSRTWQQAQAHLDPAWDTGKSTSSAVTFGRYQVPTMQQLDTIVAMLQTHPRVVIGVIDIDRSPMPPGSAYPQWAGFLAERDREAHPDRNPMLVNTVLKMWHDVLEDNGLSDRVQLVGIPRPESNPAAFEAMFPRDRFDLALPTQDGNIAHRQRNEAFADLLARPVVAVEPMTRYQPDPAQLYNAGNPRWERAIPRAALPAFHAADGPRQLFESRPKYFAPDTELGWGMKPSRDQMRDSVKVLDRWLAVAQWHNDPQTRAMIRTESARLRDQAEQGTLAPAELTRARVILDSVASGAIPTQELWQAITDPRVFQQTQATNAHHSQSVPSDYAGVIDALGAVGTAVMPDSRPRLQRDSGAEASSSPWLEPDPGLQGPAGAAPAVGE
ncbi:zeta toxin family protein [Nocardia sp. XZ_19_231]|uniref:zeta toxin family protein n=1 Tax=Nocardia sp. XZ_19_231 TaxID=2769252 RepID=UPI00188FC77B|nr:zeta toxin family protein [Nocardia sp. XZ_19_231]